MNQIQAQFEERARELFRGGLNALAVAKQVRLPPSRIVALEAEIHAETDRTGARATVQTFSPDTPREVPSPRLAVQTREPCDPEPDSNARPASSPALRIPQSNPQSVAQSPAEPGTAPVPPAVVPVPVPVVVAPPAPPVVPAPEKPAALPPVMLATQRRTSSDLRDMLFAEMRGLRDGTTTPQRALAVAKVAAQICQTVDLELRVAQFNHGGGPAGPRREVAPVVLVEGEAC